MICRNMMITLVPLLSQGIFYVLLAYQAKPTLEGCPAEQSFSARLHHINGLAIGFGDRQALDLFCVTL